MDSDFCIVKIFDLPDLVAEKILSYVDFVEICRLRLISKEMNLWSTPYFRHKAFLRFKIIEGTPFTFEFAMTTSIKLELPICELRIENTSEEIYSDPSVEEFISICGSGIRKLRISNYFIESPIQFQILDSLPNLTELKICYIDGRKHHGRYSDKCFPKCILVLPSCFQNLQILKFGRIELILLLDTDFWIPMILGSLRLRSIRYPFVDCRKSGYGINHDVKYNTFKKLIQLQKEMWPNEDLLREIDFKNINDYECIQYEPFFFMFFLDDIRTSSNRIKFVNISSAYFEHIPVPRNGFEDGKFDCVKSIVLDCFVNAFNDAPMDGIVNVCIPSLNRLLSKWVYGGWEDDWKNMESMQIHFDINEKNTECFLDLTSFFFSNERKIVEFDASFEPYSGSVLSAKLIVDGLPFLKKLTLTKWNPVNVGFVKLWRNLSSLEELWLENCPSLGNVALIGEDEEDPAFLLLKNLRKLTLVLDECPKLTDRAFKDVFRHLALTEFHIKSTTPLQNITKAGISWLLEGVFAHMILKFPFDTWSSVDILPDDMPIIKAQFTSLIY